MRSRRGRGRIDERRIAREIPAAGLTGNGPQRTMAGMAKSIGPLLNTFLFTVFVPGTVAGYVPWRLRQNAVMVSGVEQWLAFAVIVIGIGVYLYTAFWGFALVGGGTPAPIAPTKTLVVHGLHRYVRNPMYIGVGLLIAGQAWLFHSIRISVYLALFAVIVHLFVLFYEEPTLRRKFGGEYDRYRAVVPRWIPKLP